MSAPFRHCIWIIFLLGIEHPSSAQSKKELFSQLDSTTTQGLATAYPEAVPLVESVARAGRVRFYRANTRVLASIGELVRIATLDGRSVDAHGQGIVVRGHTANWYGIAFDSSNGDSIRLSLDLRPLVVSADGSWRSVTEVAGLMVRRHLPHSEFERRAKKYLSATESIRYAITPSFFRPCQQCSQLRVVSLDEIGEYVVIYEVDPSKVPKIVL